LIDSEEVIKRRFHTAKKIFGETMAFAGPDCGLGGWPTQRVAQLLLKRTVDVVRSADI
jgi:5-methyltetrahydropteroyltriglutamate--homocysteine methyltransferase